MVVILAVLVTMEGCASPTTGQSNTRVIGPSPPEAAYAQAMASCDAALADIYFSPIRSKVNIRRGAPSFDMLKDEATASDAERPAIQALAEAYIACQRRFAQFDQQYMTPMHASLRQITEDSRLRLLAQLYNRQISYARYNQAAADLQSQFQAAWAQLHEVLARERAAQAQYRFNQIANQPPPLNPGIAAGQATLRSLCESQGGTYDPASGCRQPQPVYCSGSIDASGRSWSWSSTCR
jgi:hypothetical protein